MVAMCCMMSVGFISVEVPVSVPMYLLFRPRHLEVFYKKIFLIYCYDSAQRSSAPPRRSAFAHFPLALLAEIPHVKMSNDVHLHETIQRAALPAVSL
jgi:hypothetical protein